MAKLGKLVEVEIRDVWKLETHFSDWLAQDEQTAIFCYTIPAMKNLILLSVLAVSLGVTAHAETYRIRIQATVDVLDDSGAVVGQRKLKPGTIVSIEDAASTPTSSSAAKPTLSKLARKPLVASDISPAMWINEHPAFAVLRADISLDTRYYDSFRDKQRSHWSVNISAKNSDWSYGRHFYGYVSRSTAVGKRLAADLADGKSHRALIKIKPSPVPDDDPETAIIEDYDIVATPDD